MSLRRFIAHRLLVSVPVLFGVSVITFGLVHLTPTDVVDLIIGLNPDIQPGQEEQLRQDLGFDRPVYVQYVDWLTDVLQGDFGEVYTMGSDAGPLILGRLPETALLGLFGSVFALLIAIPTGIYAAAKRGQIADDASRFVALAGISIPNFWLGLMLIAIFAVQLDLWPVLNPRAPLLSREMLWWLVLPGVTIGTAASANIMRIMRTSMAEELNKEYVTAARAKGLPEQTIILKHVLRNSLISVVTVAAFLVTNLVAGAVVVEVVFGWPGLGHLFVEAIYVREVNLIMAITLLTGTSIILANLLADILYAVLDPRIRDEY